MPSNRKRKTRITEENSKNTKRSDKSSHNDTSHQQDLAFIRDRNAKISSYVIVGATVTGTDSPRILGITLLSLKRKDMQLLNSSGLPRAENKLTLSFCTNETIQEKRTDIPHSTVDDEIKFAENDFEIISAFLNRLPAPICIISYNGPAILCQELQSIDKRFNGNVYCITLRDAIPTLCSVSMDSYEIADVHRRLCVGISTAKRAAGNSNHQRYTTADHENTLNMTVEILAKLRGRLEWIDANRDFFHK